VIFVHDFWRRFSGNSSIVPCRTANLTSPVQAIVGSASLFSVLSIFFRFAMCWTSPQVFVLVDPSSYWLFPAERLLGTLFRLVRSRIFPYAALIDAVSSKYSAELVTSFAESHVADAWENAQGKPVHHDSENYDCTGSLLKELSLL